MQLFRITRIIWTFYKSFVLSSIIITISCIGLFWKYGLSIFAALFWFKVTTLTLTFYFINSYKTNEYFYYSNLGISKVLLWTATILFDLILFILLFIQTYKFR